MIAKAEDLFVGEEMTGIWDRMFSRKKNANLLKSLQEKVQKNPQNWQAQIRLGNQLTKMGQKKAALEVYHQAAENFAKQGFIVEATAMAKIIMRLDPLQREILQKVSKLYKEWETLKGKRNGLKNEPEAIRGLGEDIWLRKQKITQ